MNEKRIELSNLIFPNINKTIEDYRKIYPNRNLKETEYVTRFAPSPTGFVHIGNFQAALIDYIIAKNSKGIFYLRNEDTDQEREIDGAIKVILETLNYYDMMPDEYEYEEKIIGNYGPYIQSKRKEIYHTFIKYLIQIDRAYPCFCTKEQLDELRKSQEEGKKRIGYYGRYAVCRRLSIEEQMDKINKGIPYVIRFKSNGDFENKFNFDDLVRGNLSLPENDQDIVIMKSENRLPTYHFAHVVDDYLMQTTHVVRGEEWLPSVSIHVELFDAFKATLPKYIHTPLLLKKDGESVRKISKRKDPEASMSYYEKLGYPKEAVIESLMTIINSNYEEWHTANPDKTFIDFEFNPKKMSATGGALYDIEKLNNISKNFISLLKASELFDRLDNWSKTYDIEFNQLINKYKEYTIDILNVERVQNKPRKDFSNYSEIKSQIFYMYDELFVNDNYEFQTINKNEDIKEILKKYLEIYNSNDDKEEWFKKVKEVCDNLGYASDMKAYKLNPENYKGNVADISTVIRVALTTKSQTPDLYEILKILGKDKIIERFNKLL